MKLLKGWVYVEYKIVTSLFQILAAPKNELFILL